jgi:hypothetical protein
MERQVLVLNLESSPANKDEEIKVNIIPSEQRISEDTTF